MNKKIVVKVKNCKMKKIEEFENFQGNLKKLTEEEKEKLKQSILKNGFNAPIFVWAGHNYILDGHQRITAVKELLEEGYELPNNELPYIEVEAEDEQQAAEMVLTYNSQYGKITEEGLKEFIEAKELDEDELSSIVDKEIFHIIKQLDRSIELEDLDLEGENPGIRYPLTFWFDDEGERDKVLAFFKNDKLGWQNKAEPNTYLLVSIVKEKTGEENE